MTSRTEQKSPWSTQPFVVLLAASSLGTVVDRQWPIPAPLWWIGGCACLAVWLGAARRASSGPATWLLLSAAGLSAGWHHCHWQLFGADELARLAPADGLERVPVCVRGEIVDCPRTIPALIGGHEGAGSGAERTRFRLRVTQVHTSSGWREASGLTAVTVDGSLRTEGLGDIVQVWALLGRIRGPANPGQRDWRWYLRSQRQLCSLWAGFPECITLQRRAQRHPRYWLRRLRARCDQVLAAHLNPRPHGLAAAILLGVRGHVTREQKEAFFRTGTIHLLAISGLHVGILAWVLLAAARAQLLPRGVALGAVVILTAVYAALTEGRAPVVRATILVHVICLSWWTRRRPSAFNSLGVAAIVVLARNPSQLFLPGAQLSFVAVAMLAGLAPYLVVRPPADPLQRLIWRSRPWPWRWARHVGLRLGQLTAASLGVWIATSPLVQYQFCVVSPVAVVLNVVLWFPVALALFSGFGVLICHGWCPPMARLWGICCDVNLGFLQSCVERAQRWPGAYWWSPSPGAIWTVLFYAALGLLLLRVRSRRGICCGGLGLAAIWWLITVTSLAWPRIAPSTLRATFLSVGHGTCVLLELPEGRNLMYDCGRRGHPQAGVDAVARSLWWRRIRRLDAVVLSHPDLDHYNILPGLLERFRVGRVYVPPAMFDAPSPSLLALKRVLTARAVEVCELSAGDHLPVPSGCQGHILHPSDRYPAGTDNAQSLVLLMRCGSRGILLPGDLEGRGLERLLARPSRRADVVMAPHHGSLGSQPQRVAAWSTARWMIVSGHDPIDQRTLEPRLAAADCGVLHTAVYGAVTVTLNSGGLDVETFRKRPR